MIFLKVTTFITGLLGAGSFNYNVTPMPDLPTCQAYLVYEAEHTRRGASRMVINQSTNFVSMELNNLTDKFHASMECVDIKAENK